jgi:hypothetical protein
MTKAIEESDFLDYEFLYRWIVSGREVPVIGPGEHNYGGEISLLSAAVSFDMPSYVIEHMPEDDPQDIFVDNELGVDFRLAEPDLADYVIAGAPGEADDYYCQFSSDGHPYDSELFVLRVLAKSLPPVAPMWKDNVVRYFAPGLPWCGVTPAVYAERFV